MSKDEFEKFRISEEDKLFCENVVAKSKGTKFEVTKSKLMRDSYIDKCKRLLKNIDKLDKEL